MFTRFFLAAALAISTLSVATPIPAQAQACGHYVVLGCFKTPNQAYKRLSDLGGPRVGGGAGTDVIHTNEYPNFRNGWYCVADGPYASNAQAKSIAWNEAVRDAYVKNAC